MRILKFLSATMLFFLLTSCSAFGSTSNHPYECCPPNDTLLANIEGDIQDAFKVSIVSGDLQQLTAIRTKLSELNKEKPFRLIEYWMAYVDYHSSITAMQHGQEDKAESLIDRAISTMKDMDDKGSEDYAMLAMAQGFGIQFKGMRAMFVSRQISNNLEKAMMLDTTNLRAFYVAGSNDFYTPTQYGGGKRVEEYLKKALSLKDRSAANPYLPSWGRALAYEILLSYYIKKEEWSKAKSTYKEATQLYPDSYMINQMASKLIDK